MKESRVTPVPWRIVIAFWTYRAVKVKLVNGSTKIDFVSSYFVETCLSNFLDFSNSVKLRFMSMLHPRNLVQKVHSRLKKYKVIRLLKTKNTHNRCTVQLWVMKFTCLWLFAWLFCTGQERAHLLCKLT